MIDRVDKTIILYGPNELEFDSQGYGVLSDASNAIATEELNGKYEVTFEYPMNGIHFNELVLGRIVLVNPTPFAGKQPFRIYQISKPLKGIVKVSAQHLSYDLSDCPVDPVEEFTVTEPSQIWEVISNAWTTFMGTDIPYEFESNLSLTSGVKVKIDDITTARALLGDDEYSIVSLFGGELEYGYNPETGKIIISHTDVRGKNPTGTSEDTYTSWPEIRYGKNLTDLTQDEKSTNLGTHVYAYYKSGSEFTKIQDDPDRRVYNSLYSLMEAYDATKKYYYGDLCSSTVDGKVYKCVYADSDGLVGHAPEEVGYWDLQNKKIISMNLSSEIEEDQVTDDMLYQAMLNSIKKNNIGKPEVNLTVSFAQLMMSNEYQQYALLENVNLGDYILVKFVRLGVQTWARVTQTEYNILTGKYTKITVSQSGTNTTSLASTVANITKNVNNVTKTQYKSKLYREMARIGAMITGNKGGYVSMRDMNDDGHPDAITVSDDMDLNNSEAVWMWNKEGLGFFPNYKDDKQTSLAAITQDGKIVADRILTGTLDADKISVQNLDGGSIKAGTITASKLSIATAGNNILKNSAGQANQSIVTEQDVPFWEGEGTSYATLVLNGENTGDDDSLALATKSGSFIKVGPGKTLTQAVNVSSAKTTFSFLAYATSEQLVPSWSVKLYNGSIADENLLASFPQGQVTYVNNTWLEFECMLEGLTNAGTIIVELAASEEVSTTAYFSDIMLADGDVYSSWTPAMSEIYGNNVLINEEGIMVTSTDSADSAKTKITNKAFSVYYGDEERIHVDGQNTFLDKTSVRNILRISQNVTTGSEPKYTERVFISPSNYGIEFYVSGKTDE